MRVPRTSSDQTKELEARLERSEQTVKQLEKTRDQQDSYIIGLETARQLMGVDPDGAEDEFDRFERERNIQLKERIRQQDSEVRQKDKENRELSEENLRLKARVTELEESHLRAPQQAFQVNANAPGQQNSMVNSNGDTNVNNPFQVIINNAPGTDSLPIRTMQAVSAAITNQDPVALSAAGNINNERRAPVTHRGRVPKFTDRCEIEKREGNCPRLRCVYLHRDQMHIYKNHIQSLPANPQDKKMKRL